MKIFLRPDLQKLIADSRFVWNNKNKYLVLTTIKINILEKM